MKNVWIWMLAILSITVLSAGKCSDLFSGDDDDDDDDSDHSWDFHDDDDDDDDDNDNNDVPKDVEDFLDEDDLEALEQTGMKIYKGSDPPNIEGKYFLDSIEIAYDDLDLVLNIVDYEYEFYNQTSDGEISMSYNAPDANDQATGVGAFISGDDKCFSVFLDIEGNANGCEYENPGIISGCLTSSGITDWANGFIMGEKSGDNCDMLVETGHRRVLEEADGLAAEMSREATKRTVKAGHSMVAR